MHFRLGPSEGNAIIKCDGDHEFEVGYHISCLPKVPGRGGELLSPIVDLSMEWLCNDCVEAGLFIVSSVKDKRIVRSKVQYLVSYVGYDDSYDKWQSYSHLSQTPAIKEMISKFNKTARSK